MNNLLNGENFKSIANVVIDQTTLKNKRNYCDKDIIFCKTDYIGLLFNEISNHKNSYTLITHQSDYEIDEYVFNFKPQCIKKWYAQNVNHVHQDLIPLPIGLENHIGPSKGIFTDFDYWKNQYSFEKKYKKTNIVYCNFTPDNHPSRKEWIEKLELNGIKTTTEKTSYKEHIENLQKSYFCISPRGNGIDCHRTWEALYFDCIPIVPKHFMYDAFKNCIFQALDVGTINLKNLQNSKLKNQINKDELKLSFWKNKILIYYRILLKD